MKRYDLITPEGTCDFILEDCEARRNVENKLHDIFKSKGYSEIVTPGLEFYDVFNLNSAYFPQESLYKLVDNKGRLLVVRPDSTMPIARVAATRLKEQPLPLRLYYSQSVYRNKPVMRGRNDEILQTGIELIGSSSRRADLEVITTAVEVLSTCGSEHFRLEIGDIGFFRELVNMLDTDKDTKENIRSLIEVKNYPALNDLLDSIGNNEVTHALKQLPRLFGGKEVFEKASCLIKDDKISSILSYLKQIFDELSALGYKENITVDFGIVNKMDYYTGIVMKGYLEGYGTAVLSGGRYNNLIAEFGYDVPATGFAVNVDAVSKILKQISKVKNKPADAIVFGEDGFEIKALVYLKKLTDSGMKAENSVFDTVEDTIEYAANKGIKKLIIVSDTIQEKELGGTK
jgi:ATP phosphoribosyltransferase regulatory subunit